MGIVPLGMPPTAHPGTGSAKHPALCSEPPFAGCSHLAECCQGGWRVAVTLGSHQHGVCSRAPCCLPALPRYDGP